MAPELFEAVLRALVTRRSRRGAVGAIAAIAATSTTLTEARKRWKSEKRKNKNEKRKNKNKNKKSRNKDGDKNKGTSGGGCTVRHSEQEILNFIAKAADEYGQPENAMVRVARCESVLDPCAVNHSGPYYGLFQFLKSTWKTTPYGDRDIFDPEAQSLATAWMWKQGRRNEWVCQ